MWSTYESNAAVSFFLEAKETVHFSVSVGHSVLIYFVLSKLEYNMGEFKFVNEDHILFKGFIVSFMNWCIFFRSMLFNGVVSLTFLVLFDVR